MSKFLTGNALNDAIEKTIWDAEEKLLIVSPYIKLDDHFKKLFYKHEQNPDLHLMLVFGKNETEVKRSMSKEDFDYFKKFPNVSIVHVPNLHAKYYGNEFQGVITSINLYDFSFKNNIEFGVYSEQSFINTFKKTADNEAWNTCFEIAESHDAVFIKRPIFQHKGILITKSRNYVGSKILLDETDQFYGMFKKQRPSGRKFIDFPPELDFEDNPGERPIREKEELPIHGFCIRTGTQIKFNPKQPMSSDAWKSWNKFGNPDYPEKYCHKTGMPSEGKTSMKNPIL